MSAGPTPLDLGVQVLVMAKNPVPGRVKTRLTPPYSPVAAADLAGAALLDTLDAVCATPARRRLLVLDDDPVVPVPEGVELMTQRGGPLDERLENALADAWSVAGLPMLLVGMDTPQVTAAELTGAARALLAPGVDAVLGPAADGGFWAIGLRRWQPGLVAGVAMSRAGTGAEQLSRLRSAGLRVDLLPVQHDVDTAEDVVLVARAAPETRFAATAHRHAAPGAE